MGYRRFIDRDGRAWEIRDRSRSEWQFAPTSGNTEEAISLSPPGYERDPFEMSDEELQRLLDTVGMSQPRRAPPKSPFQD